MKRFFYWISRLFLIFIFLSPLLLMVFPNVLLMFSHANAAQIVFILGISFYVLFATSPLTVSVLKVCKWSFAITIVIIVVFGLGFMFDDTGHMRWLGPVFSFVLDMELFTLLFLEFIETNQSY